jgi:hypothetical protein
MFEREGLIRRLTRWRSEWEQSILSAAQAGDELARSLLGRFKPDFEALLNGLSAGARERQQDLWAAEPGVFDVGPLVERIRRRIAELDLSEFVTCAGPKHERTARRGR